MRILNIFKRKEYLLGLVIIVINLFIVKSCFNIYIHEQTKDIYRIGLYYVIFHYLICVFLESEFNSNFFKVLQIRLEKIISYISIIAIAPLAIIVQLGILFYSLVYLYYKQTCPYSLNKMDYKLHFKRRCELYNINKENIYPFQYICSTNEEKYKFIEEKNINIIFTSNYSDVKCSKVEKLIYNNKVIDEFVNEYYKEDLYYCSLKKQIKKFPKVLLSRKCDDKLSPLIIFGSLNYILSAIFIYWQFSYFMNIRANIEIEPDYSHLKSD